MSVSPTIVWFRQDLRLQDNPALHAAIARGGPIVPVHVFDPAGEWGWPPGAASRWWLHHSLAALDASLRERGSRLVILRGDSEKVLRNVLRETGAGAVFWNRRYELAAVARDGWIESDLAAHGVEVRTFNGSLLHEPHEVANRQGRPYQVFAPFWRHCLTLPIRSVWKIGAAQLPPPGEWPRSMALDDLALLPREGWAHELRETWQPGEAGAARRLRSFVGRAMADYATARDQLAEPGTSRLSPHLHFGEVSPQQIWSAVRNAGGDSGVFPANRGAAAFLRELGWREFAYHLLFNFPHTQELPLREEFARFRWRADPNGEKLRAWQRGRTGYPVVDAGLRELLATGWMHNRARMIVASFLVKHLRLPWRTGAVWFWDTLVDADLANNTLGWQWSAGCGADAAPYFRIFAPVLQGKKFDPQGDYVRRWAPELAGLPTEFVHAPWTAPAAVLANAGITLGETYPRPIVDHAAARDDALAAFRELRDLAAR